MTKLQDAVYLFPAQNQDIFHVNLITPNKKFLTNQLCDKN